ncbi:hypothetical protein JW758_06110 [Candidatus Peregrinibacteria bacterium]|nr:hypothetical protein [Candidatus Peregrinibacteria bacterium]
MSQDIAPLIILFIAFLIAFMLVELLFIYVLNRLQKRYWVFVVDNLMRTRIHHRQAVKIAAVFGIIAAVLMVLTLTPFVEVLRASKPILKIFMLVLLASMVLVYVTTTRKMTRLALEKQVHSYMYFIVSIFLFVFITIATDQTYNSYQNYINTQFVDVASKSIELGMNSIDEKRLISKFKEEYLSGGCEEIDYSKVEDPGLIQFVFITTDLEIAQQQNTPSEDFLLQGYKCTDGENTMLLTKGGKWYWVISENQ